MARAVEVAGVPTIYRHRGYRFFFSNEGDPREPPHVHVRHGERVAESWLVPRVALASAWQMSVAELNMLHGIVQEQRETFERAWHEHVP